MKPMKMISCALLGISFLAGCRKSEEQELPHLAVEPAPEQLVFGASDTKSYTYRVETNQDAWTAQSDREWCVVTPDYAGGTFTVSALPNDATAAPEPATITVTAGQATPLTFTATQEAARYEVYVVGYYRAENQNYGGCYWKDGEFFPLPVPDGGYSADTYRIAVDNGSVYVIGRYKVEDKTVYGHWKDGDFVELSIGADVQEYYIDAFAFAGGSVYFGGTCLQNEAAWSCFWKDDVLTTFTEPVGVELGISDMTVFGDKVYLAGDYWVGEETCVCYWTDDEFVPLGEPGSWEDTRAEGIIVSNGRVCVLGPVENDKALLWIDGKKREYDFPQGVGFPHTLSICSAPDESIHFLGGYDSNDSFCACWWDEQGNRTDLKGIYRATSIAAAGGSVYVAGLNAERDDPCYWKDGEPVDLSVPENTREVEVEHICVVKK